MFSWAAIQPDDIVYYLWDGPFKGSHQCIKMLTVQLRGDEEEVGTDTLKIVTV